MAHTTDTAIEILDADNTALTLPADAHGLPWAAIMQGWREELHQRRGSSRTPTEYLRYAGHLKAAMEQTGRGLEDATPRDVMAFAYAALPNARLGGAPGKKPGPASVNVRLAAIRSLFDYLKRMGYADGNPAEADRVKRPTLPTPEPKGLDPDRINALLDATPPHSSGEPTRAAIHTLILTGLRRAELLALTAADVTVDAGRPYFRVRVKGGKIRRRELPRTAFEGIRAYLQAAGTPLESLPATARLFPISSSHLYDTIREAGEAIGIEGLAPHALRHSAAKLRRQAGASLEEVQELLGHASVATTARYLQHLEGETDTGWEAAESVLQSARSGKGR